MFNWNAQEDILALAREEAVLAGEKARLQVELAEEDEKEEVVRRSIRSRLARTLVQIGMKIDPLAADDLNDAD